MPRIIAAAGMLLLAGAAAIAAESAPADRVYANGVVFTADASRPTAQAVAIRDGRIAYVGDDAGLAAFIGPQTTRVDLAGRFLMPGLIDGHMHPVEAGATLLKCSLHYDPLTVAELQKRIQSCLDDTKSEGTDAWLEVVSWFQESMRPAGVTTSRADLDVLDTKRPIVVRSSFGHTVLANSRALELAGITSSTPEPLDGKIWRDAVGKPTGLLEDSAHAVFDTLLPKPTAADDERAALAAVDAMTRQGITSFLDASAADEDIAAFAAVRRSGKLAMRAHFAVTLESADADDPAAAVARVMSFRNRYDEGAIVAKPGITVRNAKLFLDGVIAAPALTGAMLEPYRRNAGTAAEPRWIEGTSRGPAVYFPAPALAALLTALGRAGIDPHMHADGDAAVRAGLDGVEALRKALPAADIRPAIAHDEIVSPSDFGRYKSLDVTAVLSLQWGKPAGDTIGLTGYFGPDRMKILEPSGLLAAAGARIAYGSDWPVDALDEWFAYKVGVARTNVPDSPPEFRGRLGDDPGLSAEAVLRAATINAAYELHQDDVTGSVQAGKFADLIVLDRNPLTIPAEEIAGTRVLETVVGGEVVYTTLDAK